MSFVNNGLSVTNFPPGYAWYKKLGANITYRFSNLPLSFRKNNLSREDIRVMRSILEYGDIILWGDFCQASQFFIDWVVTHAMAYLWKGKWIHSHAHGVSFFKRRMIFRTYDTILILRPRWTSDIQVSTYKEALFSKLGKPYDFFFWLKESEEEAYFCTELINNSLKEVGYDTWLVSIKDPQDLVDETLDSVFRAHRLLTPDEMIYGNFEVVFHSHNIILENGKYRLVEWSVCE